MRQVRAQALAADGRQRQQLVPAVEGGTGGSIAPVASSTSHEGGARSGLGAGRSPSPQPPDEDMTKRAWQVCRQAYVADELATCIDK